MIKIKGLVKATSVTLIGLALVAMLSVEAKTENYNLLPSAGFNFFFADNPTSVKSIKEEKTGRKSVKGNSKVKAKAAGFDADFSIDITEKAQYNPQLNIFDQKIEKTVEQIENTEGSPSILEESQKTVTDNNGPEEITSSEGNDSELGNTDSLQENSNPSVNEDSASEAESSTEETVSEENEETENDDDEIDLDELEIEETKTPVTDKGIKEAERSIEARFEEEGFKNLVIAQCNGWVNVRSEAGEDSEVVGKLYNKSAGEFIEDQDGWYKISSGTVTGFVKAEYCVTGEEAVELAKKVGTRVAIVESDNGMYVREQPSTDAAKVCTVANGEVLTVSEELDGWVKVNVEEGDYYVSLDFVRLSTEFVKAESKAEEEARLAKEERERQAAREAANAANRNNNNNNNANNNNGGKGRYNPANEVTYVSSGGSELGIQVANYALQFKGNPYVYGGSDPVHGADCSGFVMAIYKHFGVSLPHSANADRKMGYAVDGLANAQPGDLICYSGHVGIYIGSGQIIHASTTKTGIKISDANYRTPLAVRRIF